MALSRVGVSLGTATYNNTVTEPAGCQSGDLVVIIASYFYASATVSIAGFSSAILRDDPPGSHLQIFTATRGSTAISCGPTGSGASNIVTSAGGNSGNVDFILSMIVYRGHDTTTPIQTSESVGSTSGAFPSFSGVTVARNGSELVAAASGYSGAPTAFTGTGISWTNHGGALGEQFFASASVNSGATGSIGNTGGSTNENSGILFVVQPALTDGGSIDSTSTWSANGSISGMGIQSSSAVVYGSTSVAPTIPSGSSGDLLLYIAGTKPDTATPGTLTGWTALTPISGGGGTNGVDAGPTKIAAYYKVSDGTESGTLSLTITSGNSSWGQIHRFRKDSAATWSVTSVGGTDSTTGAAWSVTCGSDPGLQTGDYAFVASCIPTDVGAGAQFSAYGITATGTTWTGFTEVSEAFSSTGNDVGGFTFYGAVASGTSSAAPVVTATASGTTTNIRGPSMLIRIRAVAGAISASLTNSSTQTATLTGIAPIAASITNSSTQTAVLTTTNGGSITCSSTATGTLQAIGALASSITNSSAQTATLQGLRQIVGSATGSSAGTPTNTVRSSVIDTASFGIAWPTNAPGTFRDVGGNGNWVVPYMITGVATSSGRKIALKVSTDSGASWSTVTSSTDYMVNNGDFFQSAVQSSDGKFHVFGPTFDGWTYRRFSLVRTGGNITGFTQEAYFALTGVSGGVNDHKSQLKVIKDQSDTECLAVAMWWSTGSTSGLYISKTLTTTPASASDFTGLGGSSTHTTLPAPTFGNHEFDVHLGQVRSTKELGVFYGQIPAEGYFNNHAIYSIFIDTTGDHTWNTSPSLVQYRDNGNSWHLAGVASSNNAIYVFPTHPTLGIRVDTMNSSGTYTEDAVTAVLTGTSTNGYQLGAKVSADGTKIFAAYVSLDSSNLNGHKVYSGGSWTSYSGTADITGSSDTSWGFSVNDDNWDDGLISANSTEPDRDLRLSGVYQTSAGGVSGTLTAVNSITASITNSSTQTATLTGRGSLVTSITNSSSQSGTLSATLAAAASLTNSSSQSGTLTATGALSGSLVNSNSSTAELIGISATSSSITNNSTVSGTLSGLAAIASTLNNTGTATGTLTGNGAISASITNSSTQTATLTGITPISGSITCTAVTTTSLTGIGNLNGTVTGTSTVSGLPVLPSGALVASLTNSAVTSGTLTGTGSVSSSVSNTGTATGTIQGIVSVSASIVCSNSSTADLIAIASCAGSVTNTSSQNGTLTGIAALETNQANTSSQTGILTATGVLAGSIVCTSTVTAATDGTTAIQASITNGSTITGILSGVGQVSASISNTSVPSGILTAVGTLAADLVCSSSSTATLAQASGSITASISNTSTVAGTLTGIGVLNGTTVGVSTCTASTTLTPILPSCTVFGNIKGINALNSKAPFLVVKLAEIYLTSQVGISADPVVIKADNNGYITVNVVQGALVEVSVPSAGILKVIQIPFSSSINLIDLLT